MRLALLLLTAALLVFGFADTTPPKKKAAPKTAAKKGALTRRTTSKRKGKSSAPAGVTGPRNHQAAPTPERYKEIQQALASKGYLKADPNGVWDAQSADALRQFQSDRKLDPSGKINAPSLIGLGLGAQTAGVSAQANQTPVPGAPVPAPR